MRKRKREREKEKQTDRERGQGSDNTDNSFLAQNRTMRRRRGPRQTG